MGLLDFFRRNKDVKKKTAKTVVGDYTIGNWSFRVDTPKRTGVLTYKENAFDKPNG